MNKILPATVLAAFTLAAAACSSSGTTASTATGTATASASATTGTETMAGQVTGAAAVTGNNGPAVPLTMTGPVATTSTFTPPNGNGTKATITFKTPHDGNLVVNATAPDANASPAVNPKTCFFSQTVHATYVVDGAKSTGTFAKATGSGKAVFYFAADGPKLASGKCNEADNAQPLSKGAVVTFTASGPLTVKP
jgi:hypothetical protein